MNKNIMINLIKKTTHMGYVTDKYTCKVFFLFLLVFFFKFLLEVNEYIISDQLDVIILVLMISHNYLIKKNIV